jgi:hypothetical protein
MTRGETFGREINYLHQKSTTFEEKKELFGLYSFDFFLSPIILHMGIIKKPRAEDGERIISRKNPLLLA